jgi:hypothetical protein
MIGTPSRSRQSSIRASIQASVMKQLSTLSNKRIHQAHPYLPGQHTITNTPFSANLLNGVMLVMVPPTRIALLWLWLATFTGVNASYRRQSRSFSHNGQSNHASSIERGDTTSASSFTMPRRPLGVHPPLPLGTPHVRSMQTRLFAQRRSFQASLLQTT